MKRIAALLIAAIVLAAVLTSTLTAAAESAPSDKTLITDAESGIIMSVPKKWMGKSMSYNGSSATAVIPNKCCTLQGVGSDCQILLGSTELSKVAPDKTELQLQSFSLNALSAYLTPAPNESIYSTGINRFLLMERTDTRTECYSTRNQRVYMLDFRLDDTSLTEEQRSDIITTVLDSVVLLPPVSKVSTVTTPPYRKTTSSGSSAWTGFLFFCIIGGFIIWGVVFRKRKRESMAEAAQVAALAKKTPPPTPSKPQPMPQLPERPKPEPYKEPEKSRVVLVHREYDTELPESGTLLELSLDIVADEAQATYAYVAESSEFGKYVAADSIILERPVLLPFDAKLVADYLERDLPFDKMQYPDVIDSEAVQAWCSYVTAYFSGEE